ncbi:MAG: FxsA family protein [Chromatiaceae bacterium]|nr:MAG: FxsA family protein [Chromatiaceae bacterium]
MPLLIFLFVFVGTPLVELYLLIRVGAVIGALPTIALSLLTAAIGGYLVRLQGLGVLMRVRAMLARDQLPALELLDGAVLLLTGFALLLPGFVTDIIGFLLLVPPLRQALIRRYVQVVPVTVVRPGPDAESGPRVIEGSFRREDD